MLRHEYGGPTIFFFKKGDDSLRYVAAHLEILFLKAAKASRRSVAKRFIDKVVSGLPSRLRLVDERNSVALALRHQSIERLSRIDRSLGQIVDATAQETGFGFSAEQIAHVCADDSMAAVALTTSRSGHVRELGLSQIDRVGTDIGLGIVILRLNDWVPEVRAAAVKAIERIVTHVDEPLGGPAYNIAGAIGLILDDQRFSRASDKDREIAKALLEYPRVKQAVRRLQLNDRSECTTTKNLKMMVQTGYFDELIPEIATEAECSHRRLIATRAVLDGKYVWEDEGEVQERFLDLEAHRTRVIRHALLDKSANVAFAALGHLIYSEDLECLDETTTCELMKRQEASLERRIGLLRSMIEK